MFFILVLLVWIFFINFIKTGLKLRQTRDQKMRGILSGVSNTIVYTLLLISFFYNVFALIFCIAIWTYLIPIVIGDVYYSRERVKISMKRCKESYERLKETIKRGERIDKEHKEFLKKEEMK